MELVMADVLARYMRQHQADVLFATGTDEHGGKIAEKAKEMKLTPQQFVDQNSQKFQALHNTLNLSNDRFIRTTNPGHEQRSQLIWKRLARHIYKGTYSGWYCTGDEAYFPEQLVKANNGVCPTHNRAYEKLQEENYFFKLSAFSDKVKQAVENDSPRIIPESRQHEILNILNSGLEDISISRPKNKIEWGIAVPGDESQVMYVWFEALMNYITVLGYPEHTDFKKYWPADVQVIGKDILRFHAAIWPAMLMALELPLPNVLYVHGFVNSAGQKMSKSLGNVVAPKDITSKYNADTFRYFFLRHIPSHGDGDFSWERLEAAYNNELADQLGNTVQRTAAMISKYLDGIIGDIPDPGHDIAQFEQAMQDCRFDKALDEIWEQIKGLNQYIDETKPWALAKDRIQDPNHLREVLAYIVACVLEIATLLTPFLPETAAKIQATFGSGVLKTLTAPLFPKTTEATEPSRA